MFFKKRVRHILAYLYNKYRFRNKKVKIRYSSNISIRSEMEDYSVVCPGVNFHGTIGTGSFIGPGGNISAYIGRYSSIGGNVSFVNAKHPYKAPFATTSPCFFSIAKHCGFTFAKEQKFEEFCYYDKEREITIKIGNDCWIGIDVCFVGGIEVGDGAVVMTRAMVTKDVPPYAIVGGVPARIIGYRYDEETISFLKRIEWWNMPFDWLQEHSELFCDIELLKQHFKNSDRETNEK